MKENPNWVAKGLVNAVGSSEKEIKENYSLLKEMNLNGNLFEKNNTTIEKMLMKVIDVI